MSAPDDREAAGAAVEALDALEARLGYRFEDRDKLVRALTHVSYANEAYRDISRSYERYEFLGDALLGFVVSERLVAADPGADEGVLTKRKQIVVRTGTLARAAEAIGLGAALRLSRGEQATGGRRKTSLLADVFEAVLGAVFLDGGIRPARALVRRHLSGAIEQANAAVEVGADFKTRLQELLQGRLRRTPAYRIVSESGPDHARTFVAEVRVQGRVLGRGEGTSRERAEQSAAREALATLERDEGDEGGP